MKFLPSNTLAYFQAAPQMHRHDFSHMPVSVFAAATKEYRKSCGLTKPDEDALTFYALNHYAALVRKSFTPHEPLPKWASMVMTHYLEACASQGNRMLHYILCICAREMRHLSALDHSPLFVHVKNHHGLAMKKFVQEIMTHADEMEAINTYVTTPPKVNTVDYIKAMAYLFHNAGTGFQGGYGGPKWGVVADAAVAMLSGETSMEMLVDTGYNLAHNGGPIFNKSMMYHQLGWQTTLPIILDVQRTGQIPELLLETVNLSSIPKPPMVLAVTKAVVEQRTTEFKGWVDWIAVDAMRPQHDKHENPHKYDLHLQQQKKAHPEVSAKKVQQLITMLHGQKIKVTGTWAVFPGQTVDVYERVTK